MHIYTILYSNDKNNKDLAAYQGALKRINGDLKTETQSASDLQTKLKAEGAVSKPFNELSIKIRLNILQSPELLDKINELQRLDKLMKEQLSQQATLAEKLVTGKVSKPLFLETDKKIANAKEDLVQKLENVTACLNFL